MSKRGPENVLLLVPDADRARLAGVLAPLAGQVWKSLAELPPGVLPDLVVIDGSTDRTAAKAPCVHATGTTVGIIAIGHDPADRAEDPGPTADVVLAPDFTDRELRITGRLVTRIARLRGELSAGARREAEVRQIADTDPLTGLANRRVWERYFKCLVQDSAAVERWLAVVDLDRFKQVNDTLGMACGDAALKRVADALARQLRRDDLIVRLGGDEFAVVLSHVTADNARHVFERLRNAVTAECTPAGGTPLSVSIGYVPLAMPAAPEKLLAAAERAMRMAKRQGGNQVVLGDQDFEPDEATSLPRN